MTATSTERLGPFDGGLNLRDAYTEIAPNELADGTNLTLDERGVAVKRNDCPVSAAFPVVPPGTVIAAFYSQNLQVAVIQVAGQLYKAAQGAGAWTAFGIGTHTTPGINFVDFAGKLCYVEQASTTAYKVYTYDGTTEVLAATITVPAVVTTTFRQPPVAVWQNKLFFAAVGGITAAGALGTLSLFWSALGNPASFAALDFVDVREKDDKPILALYPASGLLVFKEDSTYRVNDSSNGSFQTIDWNAGCVGPLAVCGSDEGIFHWGLDGLYKTSGLGPSVNIGDKFRPRFAAAAINATTKLLIAGVAINGRIYFAFSRTSTNVPDAIMEYNPRVGWLMEASFVGSRVGPFFKYQNAAGLIVATFVSAAVAAKDLYTGTTRTGFSCSLATGYLESFGGKLARVLRLRPELTLPAAAPVVCGLNYTDASGAPQVLTFPSVTFTSAGTQRPNFWPASVGRAFQVFLNDTATPLASLSVLQVAIDAIELER